MVNWFDLMRQAQGGAAMDNMARQFGLSPQQTQAAMAALLPAFAMGLQRTATNPNAMSDFARLMSAGHYSSFFESAASAFSPQAKQEGTSALHQLFGSDDVSKKVAQQAAAFSGIGTEMMQQILPLAASIFLGGLAKMAAAQAAPPQAPSQSGLGAWADMWSGFLKSAQPAPQAQAPAGASFEEMMASFLGKPKAPEPPPKPEAPDPFKAWGQMMEQGREMQEQHLASLKSILDGWGRKPE